ncbi:MAG: hypothetical protein GY938_15875, partial [Ketobacter sp.]|nr:hypothetical protein [Ketobacter sp.]
MNEEYSVEAALTIELNVDCPHCSHYFDLMTYKDLNVDGAITSAACPNGQWVEMHRAFTEDVECPECGGAIEVR